MIYTVICRYEKGDCPSWQSLSDIPDAIASFIKTKRSEKTKKERVLAYTALCVALRELFLIDSFTLLHTKDGKPYIECEKNNPPKINISHSNNIAAVTLSDEGDVGVDIEICGDGENVKRLCERFFPEARLEKSNLNIKYLQFSLEECGKYLLSAFEDGYFGDGASDVSLWTYCEAIMKCDGRGFGAAGEISTLSHTYSVETRLVEIEGKKFSISTAKEK